MKNTHKIFVISNVRGRTSAQKNNSIKITIGHATVYFRLILRGLYWVIYISFILSCATKARRFFYELSLGIGEAHHG